jgi:hypothetical protein
MSVACECQHGRHLHLLKYSSSFPNRKLSNWNNQHTVFSKFASTHPIPRWRTVLQYSGTSIVYRIQQHFVLDGAELASGECHQQLTSINTAKRQIPHQTSTETAGSTFILAVQDHHSDETPVKCRTTVTGRRFRLHEGIRKSVERKGATKMTATSSAGSEIQYSRPAGASGNLPTQTPWV